MWLPRAMYLQYLHLTVTYRIYNMDVQMYPQKHTVLK